MFIKKGEGYWDNRFLEDYDTEHIDDQVRQYFKYLTDRDWEIISEYCKLRIRFIECYKEYIQWDYVSENPYLTEEIIEKYEWNLNWERVWRTYRYIDKQFLKKYRNNICSTSFCENKYISYDLIHYVAKYLDWYHISWVRWITTEDFIREFKDYVIWDIIVKNECELSESFIREFIGCFDIYELARHRLGFQNMKDLLREYKDRIDWNVYRNGGHSITDNYIELHDYWWNKKRNNRERLKYGTLD